MQKLMSLFNNISSYFPNDSRQTEKYVMSCYKKKGPTFISLKTDKKIIKKF